MQVELLTEYICMLQDFIANDFLFNHRIDPTSHLSYNIDPASPRGGLASLRCQRV